MKLSLGKKVAGLAVAGAVLTGAGTVAWAQTSPSTSSPASSAPAAAGKASGKAGKASGKASAQAAGKGLALLKRADHGEVEVRVKGTGTATAATWKTVTFDRGQVSDVAGDHITLARPDGQSVTLTIGADTKFRGVTSAQQVQKAKGAIVVSENGKATLVIQKADAAPAA